MGRQARSEGRREMRSGGRKKRRVDVWTRFCKFCKGFGSGVQVPGEGKGWYDIQTPDELISFSFERYHVQPISVFGFYTSSRTKNLTLPIAW